MKRILSKNHSTFRYKTKYYFKKREKSLLGPIVILLNIIASIYWALKHDDKNIEIYLVLFSGYHDIFGLFLKKKLFRKNYIIVFEPLVSQYDTVMFNKPPSHLRILHNLNSRLLDSLSFKLADIVLIDTNANKEYLCELLDINPRKVRINYLAANADYFNPNKYSECDFLSKKLKIIWYGRPSKLHNLSVIVEAFKIVESKGKNIEFTLIAPIASINTILSEKQKAYLFSSNCINFIEWFNGDYQEEISLKELSGIIAKNHVVLGCFGSTKKSECVIINKEYEALAMQKALITRTASKEFLKSGINCIMVPPDNPEALAEAILKLYKNRDLLEKIATKGYNGYLLNCSEEVMLDNLESILKGVKS
jgi:glycosyltransferase involved in cell wall biosynthesis